MILCTSIIRILMRFDHNSPRYTSLKHLIRVLTKLGVPCHLENLTIGIYNREVVVTRKGTDNEENISHHRRRDGYDWLRKREDGN